MDEFFFQVVFFTITAELRSIIKLVLVLSDDQASIERDFDVNKAILKVNMNGNYQGRKIIIDHMQKNNLNPA